MKKHSISLIWEEEKTPSLNEWYKAQLWPNRKKLKDKWDTRFLSLLSCHEKVCFKEHALLLEYNSKIDLSNIAAVVKMIKDIMKKRQWIIDDSPKYFKSLNVFNNKKLEKNVYKATVAGYVFGQ